MTDSFLNARQPSLPQEPSPELVVRAHIASRGQGPLRGADGLDKVRHEVERPGGEAFVVSLDVADADAVFAACGERKKSRPKSYFSARSMRKRINVQKWKNAPRCTNVGPLLILLAPGTKLPAPPLECPLAKTSNSEVSIREARPQIRIRGSSPLRAEEHLKASCMDPGSRHPSAYEWPAHELHGHALLPADQRNAALSWPASRSD